MEPNRRVILLVEAASAYGRGCLRGIARYARAHGGWTFFHGTRYLTSPPKLADLQAFKGDGIIARVENDYIADLVLKLKLPTVDIRGPVSRVGAPGIFTDDYKVIEVAADHLVSNGIRHLCFCGYPGIDFSDAREKAFLKYVQPGGGDKRVFKPSRVPHAKQDNVSYEKRGVADRIDLQAWLTELPRPAGVIACNDTRARQILEACAAANVKVPYEISVVGVDDDDVVCELSNPPLTSVVPNVEGIGFDAAGLLDRMIQGEPPPKAPIYVPPVTIEVRSSSDMTALGDPTLLRAVRLIRSKIGDGINVKALLAEIHISRSTFERQFREHLGCTPYEYILRCRIDRVKQLLVDTNYPISRVTRMAGFRQVSHMTAVFRTRTGTTPSQYRQSSV